MKNKMLPIIFIIILVVALIALILIVIFTDSNRGMEDNIPNINVQNLNTSTNAGANTVTNASNVITESLIDKEQFTDRDKEIGYSNSDYVTIILSDNNSTTSDSKNVAISSNVITIKDEGTYVFSGSLSNGQIVVEAEDTDKIQLVLNNASISSSSSSPIYVKVADKVFITLDNGSNNTLGTTGEYVAIDDNNIDSVIFSKEDLTLNGNGTLNINSNYGHGVVSKDDLVVTSGIYNITVSGHGLSGKDSVRIASGTLNIKAGNKGIKAENEEDTTLGYIYIVGGNIAIEAEDDALHSNLDIYINGGNLTLSAGDDGIHADSTISINSGIINIKKSYEGIEAQNIEINGGEITLISSDDGLNAAGGNDSSGNTNMFGKQDKGGFNAVEDAYIKITGGKLYVNAQGDGLDSNGNLYISGGETYVSGSTNNGNGALDYNGEATITGGICMAIGASGMAQNFGSNSTQGAILVNLSSAQIVGTTVTLTDKSNNVIATYTPEKQYNSVVVSSPEIKQGETYILKCGTNSQEIAMSSLIYGNGFSVGGGMKGGMPGGMPQLKENMGDFNSKMNGTLF